MSIMICISFRDEERLVRFARKVDASSLAEAFGIVLLLAEEKLEEFKGDIDSLKDY